MAGILQRVATLAINRAPCGNIHMQMRTIFSSTGIGIDNFKATREQHIARHAPSIDAFKQRFVESIAQSNIQIFTEDLRSMIMAANTDQEIDTVIQGLKKYNSNKVKFSDYHFGSPVMRLLYIQNKVDLALELYMDESLTNIFNDSASALVLMNKLIEEKRYDDVTKIFEYGSKRGFLTSSGRTYPIDVVMLAIEALYRKNTKESFAKAKELISNVKARDPNLNPRTAVMTALLAIQQGEPAFAMEILGAVRIQNSNLIKNVRAICYADLGRTEEAINAVQLLAEQTVANRDRRRVFPLVMRHLRAVAEKVNDTSLLTRFEELSKTVLKNNSLSTTDLPDFLAQPINRRGPMPKGSQRFNREDFRRPSGGNFRNREGFEQRSDKFRNDRMGDFNRQGGGFNRENRFGNNNFQRRDTGFERRSQDWNVDGGQRRRENDRFFTRNQQQSQGFTRFNRDNGDATRTQDDNVSTKQTKQKRQSNDANQSQDQGPWERVDRQ